MIPRVRRRVVRAWVLCGWLAVHLPGAEPASGQVLPVRVSSAVAPDIVTVGDRFRSVLQVVVPRGARVLFPEFPSGDTLQAVDSVRVVPGRNGEPPIAVYSLTAWRVDVPLQAQVPVRVSLPDGTAATYLIPLRLPEVRSVLPTDTSRLLPQPGRGVFALPRAPRPWWPWLLLFAVCGLLGLWLRRRLLGRGEAAATPRERALLALDRAEDAWSHRHEAARLYPDVSAALRRYLAELNPDWGVEHTTGELLNRLRTQGLEDESVEALARLLEHADMVKFSGYVPDPAEAAGWTEDVRAWVLAYPAPPVGGIPGEAV